MSENDLVSIIVLTYNSKNFLDSCIDSISNQEYDNFELIIVDNNSTDDTKKKLSELRLKKSIQTKIILNSDNLGFNLGNKIGIDNAHGKFIAIINPDVILEKFWLLNIMRLIKNKPEIAVVSGKFLNSKKEISGTGGIMDIYGAVRQRKISEIDQTTFFYSPGSAFLFRRKILETITFDPNLFMYYDDVDFAWQARLLDYKIEYCNSANAIHFEGHSYRTMTPSKFFHIAKNRLYVCNKNYSLNRIIRRIIPIMFLIFLDSVFYSITLKSPKFFTNGIKAFLWNLANFKKLRIERTKIQKRRNIPDSKLEEALHNKSIELEMFFK